VIFDPIHTFLNSETNQSTCYHCGDDCEGNPIQHDQKAFCCNGCKTVYEILSSNELCDYYELEHTPGISQKKPNTASLFDYLDNQSIRKQLLDFASEDYERVSLTVPNIRCSSCIWLLENLSRLNPAILDSKVDFTQKQLTLHYAPKEITLKALAELLDTNLPSRWKTP
jgi:Cu+-exporting ATPase